MALKKVCLIGKHRFRDNEFGVTWCIECGLLSNKPSGIPFNPLEKVDPNYKLPESSKSKN